MIINIHKFLKRDKPRNTPIYARPATIEIGYSYTF